MDMAKDLVKYIQIVKIEIVMQRGCFWWNLKEDSFFLMENIVLNSMYL